MTKIEDMRNKFKQHRVSGLIAISLISLLFSACGSSPKYGYGNTKSNTKIVLKTAKNMLGIKYRYGGTSPSRGFDCSGLVQYSHKAAGINLPRTTSLQFKSAKRISRKYLQAGDLVFFKTSPSRSVSHVGIYLGNNKFIHAPSSGKHVKISSMKERYWRKRFTGGGRVL